MHALVQVLDYGSGNLFSIGDALGRVSPDIKVNVSSKYQKGKIGGLVLPGVGSFTSAQRILGENRKAILDDIESGMPILGVCLGMQLMFEKSEEGTGKGLELFRGNVLKFKPEPNLKVPHMGWNNLKISNAKSLICKGLSKEEWVYYVHSFYPSPEDEGIVSGWTTYGTQRFPAVIERYNIFGTQFHPEKSSKAGFKMIRNFARCVLAYSR
ncbi:MAG: imidazole glycerol phosphate synthase subunit HisH [Nitrososphaerota archaeon]|nr:imidazole glycerol phosphate synthase subunit HisH [Nitrososphaerota archaeon]